MPKPLDSELATYALVGIRAEIARLDAIATLLARANGHPALESPSPRKARRRTPSAAQRAATSKRMKAYWRQRKAQGVK